MNDKFMPYLTTAVLAVLALVAAFSASAPDFWGNVAVVAGFLISVVAYVHITEKPMKWFATLVDWAGSPYHRIYKCCLFVGLFVGTLVGYGLGFALAGSGAFAVLALLLGLVPGALMGVVLGTCFGVLVFLIRGGVHSFALFSDK